MYWQILNLISLATNDSGWHHVYLQFTETLETREKDASDDINISDSCYNLTAGKSSSLTCLSVAASILSSALLKVLIIDNFYSVLSRHSSDLLEFHPVVILIVLFNKICYQASAWVWSRVDWLSGIWWLLILAFSVWKQRNIYNCLWSESLTHVCHKSKNVKIAKNFARNSSIGQLHWLTCDL